MTDILYSYLHEYQALGTAGGIYHFRDEILRGHTKQFFVMHIDIACSFPLNEMVAAHRGHRSICTMLGTKVSLCDVDGEREEEEVLCLIMNDRYLPAKPLNTAVL